MVTTNAVADSPASTASTSFVAADLPSAPTISGVTLGNDSGIVAFTAGSDGGDTVTGFTVHLHVERRRHDPVGRRHQFADHRGIAHARQDVHLHRGRH